MHVYVWKDCHKVRNINKHWYKLGRKLINWCKVGSKHTIYIELVWYKNRKWRWRDPWHHNFCNCTFPLYFQGLRSQWNKKKQIVNIAWKWVLKSDKEFATMFSCYILMFGFNPCFFLLLTWTSMKSRKWILTERRKNGMNVDYIGPRRNDKNIAVEDQRSCSFFYVYFEFQNC